eukprot:scaffold2502_cov362-Prasinococcus_capsulatus_cf.AAC.6
MRMIRLCDWMARPMLAPPSVVEAAPLPTSAQESNWYICAMFCQLEGRSRFCIVLSFRDW